jgi:hypothetical protein
LFESGLKLLKDSSELPRGYGVALDKLDGNAFDEQEDLIIGRNRKSFLIALPSPIWKPRMELWAQGLIVMSSVSSVLC